MKLKITIVPAMLASLIFVVPTQAKTKIDPADYNLSAKVVSYEEGQGRAGMGTTHNLSTGVVTGSTTVYYRDPDRERNSNRKHHLHYRNFTWVPSLYTNRYWTNLSGSLCAFISI